MDRVVTQRRLSVRTGSEGPHHDPYGYKELTTEITVGGHTNVVTLHSGLGTWVEVNGDKIDHSSIQSWGDRYEEGSAMLLTLFENLTGVAPKNFQKYLDQIQSHKKCCSKPVWNWERGYPGEYLLVCQNCHEIVDHQFRLSEVE